MKDKKEIIKSLLEYIKGFAILFVSVIFLILLTIDFYYDIKETFLKNRLRKKRKENRQYKKPDQKL